MAFAPGSALTTTGTGASDHVTLGQGTWVCFITWAGSAGDLDIQVGDGTTFVDLLDVNGAVVNVTANYAVGVMGGLSYRVDVTTHTSAATITFYNSGG